MLLAVSKAKVSENQKGCKDAFLFGWQDGVNHLIKKNLLNIFLRHLFKVRHLSSNADVTMKQPLRLELFFLIQGPTDLYFVWGRGYVSFYVNLREVINGF